MKEKAETKLTGYLKIVEKEKKVVEDRIKKSLVGRKPESLYSPGYYVVETGGKRLRPMLILLSAKAAGGSFKDAYNAAAAVELMHNFTLVHDDIMDNAGKRRNRPTLHVKYDLSTAILAGDSLLSIAYELLIKDCNHNAAEILNAFNSGLIEVCEGQSLDKEFETRKDVSVKEYYVMIQKKTAALIETCCRIGGLLGRGSKEVVKALADFGKYAGLAFQIQDDLLDITGDEKEFGKICGGDLVEGKKTYLFLAALSKAKGNDKKKLLDVIKNKGIERKDIQTYKELYEKLGVLKDAKKEILRLSNVALKKIELLPNQEDREIFYELASSLINRNK